MKRLLGCLIIVAVAMVFTGCAKNNPAAPSSMPVNGKLTFAMDATGNIASGSVTITKGTITQVLPISIVNHSGSVAFPDIQVGTWSIAVQLFDSAGVEIYSGTGTAVVNKNQTTTATIRMEQNTGNLEIVVEGPGTAVLKGYWKLDGNAVDQSGNGNHGVLVNNVPFVPGIMSQAASFSGDNTSYIDLSARANNFNNMPSYTFEAWIYPTGYKWVDPIISKVTPNRDFYFQLSETGNMDISFAINYGEYYHCWSENIVPLNQWSHVAAVWTGTKLQLYCNGNLVKESDCSGHVPQWTGTIMEIGGFDSGYNFLGKIDEVKVFEGVLTPEQIYSDWAAGAAQINP